MFGGAAAAERDADVVPLVWGPLDGLEDGEVHARVEAVVIKALDGLGPETVLMGKSLGSVAATVAADRGLPAVWFTPLLTEPKVVAALRRSTAPFLLIGGTADDWWDAEAARSLTPHVTEIADASHRMFVPGPLARSAAALGEASTAVERFLDEVAWP